MGVIVLETIMVSRIGNGTSANPFRPDTTAVSWRVIAETQTKFTIEILAG